MVEVSRWDLLHLLYSVENSPRHERDRRELDGVMLRCMSALAALHPASIIVM